MLHAYLQCERRSGRLGAVHVEVPFGGPSGGTSRRLDAVHFPHREDRTGRYDVERFREDLPGRALIELIEVKPKLNRPVIGQLVAAEILARREWGIPARRRLQLVAVVAEIDGALMLVCEELGIRVEKVSSRGPRNGA